MTNRMGSMQASVIAARLKKIHDEVTHWQAAHPDAQDTLVNSLEYYVRLGLEAARLMDENRRTPPGKESS